MEGELEVFSSYTHALRHPVLVGRIGSFVLPWMVSASQLFAATATGILLLATRAAWAHFGPVGNLALFCGLVGATAWGWRHWRVEGRSPGRFLAGAVRARVSAPARRGLRHGRPVPRPAPVVATRPGVVVVDLKAAGRDGDA